MVREPNNLTTSQPLSPATFEDRSMGTPLSIVIPCHNEAESLNNLATAMIRLQAAIREAYQIEWLLIDDGSTDRTWSILNDFFGGQPDVRLGRHDANCGLAAAIQTGIAMARSELVASLDADCSYDPEQLIPMLAMLGEGIDMVVASPYHPRGAVVGVPAWRLSL